MKWDWDDTFQALLVSVISIVVLLVLFATTQYHGVQFYFVQLGENSSCVKGFEDWQPNSGINSFCSSDIDKVMSVAAELNKQLIEVKKGKR